METEWTACPDIALKVVSMELLALIGPTRADCSHGAHCSYGAARNMEPKRV